MTPPTPAGALTRTALIEAFYGFGAPRARWRIGAELERHLLRPNGAPIRYNGCHGVQWLLEALIRRGWRPVREGALPIALVRDGAWVTLEPGGQLELSGAPHTNISGVHTEAMAFTQEVGSLLTETFPTAVTSNAC